MKIRFSQFLILACFFIFQCFPNPIFAVTSIPQPLVDPLGGLELYSNVEYAENKTRTIQLSQAGSTHLLKIGGDQWTLEAAGSGSAEVDRQTLTEYLATMGAEFLIDSRKGRLLAKIIEDKTRHWWVSADFKGDSYRLTITLVRILSPSNDLVVEIGKGVREQFIFYTEPDGRYYRTMTIEALQGYMSFKAARDEDPIGQYTRRVWYSRNLQQTASTTYRIADFPQEAGRYRWTVTTHGDTPKGLLSLKLEESGELALIERSADVGGILVKNVPNSTVYAEPEGDASFVHPDVRFSPILGDRLPNGDSLLLVPPGFWRLYTASPRSTASRMIPVKPGQQTIVHWPNYLNRAFGSENQGAIEFTGAEIGDSQGLVTFNLLGEEASTILPRVDEIRVQEGGQDGEVLSISPISIPPDLVILLDSSGSMKGQMQAALEATRGFVQSLPEDSQIRIVDFDTQPRLLSGENRQEVLASLAGVKANGATALYDTAIKGMAMLSASKRPSLVLFTDGVDANWDDSGPGSKATQEDLFKAADESSVPVFSIGFGQGHDQETLSRLSSLSGGLYFTADEPDMLAKTFDTIRESVVKGFELTYARPAQPQLTDVPVVQLVVDRSGSMSEKLASNNGMSSIDTLREITRDFVQDMSPETLVSVQSFADSSEIEQVATRDKDLMLRAIAMLESGAGTDIVKAVNLALKSLRAIPSSQRYLVFVTDEAMSISSEQKEVFDTLLAMLRDENIRTFWIGIGIDPSIPRTEEPFKHAANLSGGRYVVSKDASEIKKVFVELSETMSETPPPSSVQTTLRVDVSHRKPNGKVSAFSTASLVKVPRLESDGVRTSPDVLSYEFSVMPPRYDKEVSSLVIGDEPPGVESVVDKRIPLDVKTENSAFSVRALEAVYLSQLKGAKAPGNQRFLAITLELANQLPEQEVTIYPDGTNHPSAWTTGGAHVKGRVERRVPDYLISDLQRHLYLRLNDLQMLPVSVATWLSESPLMMPGEQSVLVKPGSVLRGSVVFLVPDEPIEQTSLHFYDIKYGHVNLALIGEFSAGVDIRDLPVSKPVRMSDAFSIAWLGAEDVGEIDGTQAPDGTIFRIVDASLQSKLQAMLAIDPFKRFFMRLPTDKGDLQFALHEATALLPLGFYQKSMMTPGSDNRIRLAFQVPAGLALKSQSQLVVDIKGDRVVVEAPQTAAEQDLKPDVSAAVAGDGISIIVNNTGSLDKIGKYRGSWRLADITLIDEKDGEATRIGKSFTLFNPEISDGIAGDETTKLASGEKRGLGNFGKSTEKDKDFSLSADSRASGLISGFTAQTVIPDGSHRRGVVLFKMPDDTEANADWKLRSAWIPELNASVSADEFSDPDMMLPRLVLESGLTDREDREFKKALTAAVKEYRAKARSKPGSHSPLQVSLDQDSTPVREIPVPSLVLAGAQRFAAIDDLDEFKKLAENLRWLPGSGEPWAYQQSPESVVTQEWGSEAEFARMAELVLSRQGYSSERDIVAVTDKGRARLAQRAGLEKVSLKWLPAMRYRDQDDVEHLLVSPFLETAAHLEGLVIVDPGKPAVREPKPASLSVIADVVTTGGERAKHTADMADALAGGSGKRKTRERTLIRTELDREQLSRGAADIIYAMGEDDKGAFYTAMLDYPGGQVAGIDKIYKSSEIIVQLRIQIRFDGQWLEHVMPVSERAEITGVFHTLGLNLPDLPTAAVEVLEKARQDEHTADHPDDLSALRWYTHGTLARFIAGQTRIEQQVAERLGIIAGRTKTPRVIVLTVFRQGEEQPLQAAIDLRQVLNDLHNGDQDAQRAYRIASGLQLSELEQVVLGEQGYGTFGLWARAPADTPLFWISQHNRRDITAYLRALSYPENVVTRLEKTRNFVLFPTQPTDINGRKRWGWLEVNPKTYETITVLDNGQYGSMVEWDIQNWFAEAQMHMFGFMVGVNTSIWGTSIFSLQTDNYEKIKEKAEALARSIGDSLADFNGLRTSGVFDMAKRMDQGGGPPASGDSGGSGGLTATLEGSFNLNGKPGGSVMDRFEGKIKLGQDLVGFGQGFSAGVDYYFEN